MIPLSQAHLTLLDACDRKYQYVFLDALSGPSTAEQQATTQWGSQFHLLMQQRALDLPVERLAQANTEMATSMTALAQVAPDVFDHLSAVSQAARSSGQAFSQSEHRRTLAFNGYLLTVVYDLLVYSSTAGQIFDWKTHQQPPRREWLQADWQTRLYLYVLCETTDLAPEQLSMTYWFVRLAAGSDLVAAGEAPEERRAASAQPTSYRFGYSRAQHQLTQEDLQRLTDRLTRMRQAGDFPKVAVEKGLCESCPFNLRCDRPSASSPLPASPYRLLQSASQLTADQVEEIPL